MKPLSAALLLGVALAAGCRSQPFVPVNCGGCVGAILTACDTYCRKPPPCGCVPTPTGCDTYCQKRPPCVCVPVALGCDRYCRKPIPSCHLGPSCRGSGDGACCCD